MKLLLIFLLLVQIAKPKTPEIKAPSIEPVEPVEQLRVTADASKPVLVVPHATYENMDARCVIVYPREGSLGWLIDRKENTATIFYLAMPWPEFCKEIKK